jgi:hypothetical protein
LGESDGRDAETVRALVDEDGLSLAEVSTIIDGVQSSAVCKEESRHNSELLSVKQLVDRASRDTHSSAKLVRSVGDGAVTHLDVRDTRTDSGDNTREVKGRGLVTAINTSQKGKDILGVQTHSLDVDVNKAGGRSSDLLGQLLEVNGVGGAGTANGQASWVSSAESLLLQSGLGLDAATEESVNVVVRAVTTDVQESLVVNELAIIAIVSSSESADGLLRSSTGLGAELADRADIEDSVSQSRLLKHESTGQTVGEGQVGLRGVAEHVATSDPEKVRNGVGNGLEACGVLDADRGQELALKLEKRDGDIGLSNLESIELLDRQDAGLRDTDGFLKVRGKGSGEVCDARRRLVRVLV